MNQMTRLAEHEDANANAFEQNLGMFGWGAILIVTGAMWLIPRNMLPEGSWLMSIGLILLGLNAARYSVRKVWNSCSVALGILALGAGVGALLHVSLPLLAIGFIVMGLLTLFVPRFELNESGYPDRHCCEQ